MAADATRDLPPAVVTTYLRFFAMIATSTSERT